MKRCVSCDKPTNREVYADLCMPCVKVRTKIRLQKARRNPNKTHHPKANGVYVCADCAIPLANGLSPRCDPCRDARAKLLLITSGQSRALCAVNKAISKGEMPRPDVLLCVDCGSKARVYDHRDYSKPLQVDPVCRRCNALRGHAVNIPYSNKEANHGR